MRFRRNLLGSFISFVVIVGVWQAIITVGHVAPYVAPTPLDAWRSILTNWSHLWPLTVTTVKETIFGFASGTALGVGLGTLLSKRRFVQRVIYPILILSQAIPIIALAPPLVLVLGFGLTPKVVIVAWVVFFPVTVSVLDGLANVDRDLLMLARAYGASPWRTFLAIEVPSASTNLFSGLKIGATYAVTGAIIGELAASSGASLAMFQHAQSAQLDAAGVYGTTMIMTAVGMSWFGAVALVEFFTTPWKRRSVARRAGHHI
jgi:ABC-type nitrate/sulfonate/bicarbonate transport system permease component